MKIILCDDDKNDIDFIENLIKSYEKNCDDLVFEINTFENSEKLLNYVEKNQDIMIALLDICMPKQSGIDVAKVIKDKNPTCEIIFCTYSKEYALDAYSVDARQYLLKPVDKSSLFDVLDKVIDLLQKKFNDFTVVKSSGKFFKLWYNDIIYAETKNNYQCIFLKNGQEIKVRMTSYEMFDILKNKEEFLRCGASFIINSKYIVSLSSKEISLIDKSIINVPRGRYKEVKDKYFEYYIKKA